MEIEDQRDEVTCQTKVLLLVSIRARTRARSQIPWSLPSCSFSPATQTGNLKSGSSCLLFSRLSNSDLPVCPLTCPLPPFHHPRGPSSIHYNWSRSPAGPLGGGSRQWLMLWRPGLLSWRLWISVGWCCAVRWGWGSVWLIPLSPTWNTVWFHQIHLPRTVELKGTREIIL